MAENAPDAQDGRDKPTPKPGKAWAIATARGRIEPNLYPNPEYAQWSRGGKSDSVIPVLIVPAEFYEAFPKDALHAANIANPAALPDVVAALEDMLATDGERAYELERTGDAFISVDEGRYLKARQVARAALARLRGDK